MIHKKWIQTASRETLDHSIMYIFAAALEDGKWHHINSYTPERDHTKRVQLNFGKRLRLLKIRNGPRNIMIPTRKKNASGEA